MISNIAPPIPQGLSTELALIHRGDEGNAVRVIQTRLASLGFYPATVDAVYGPATEQAVGAFQNSIGLPPTGAVDNRTLHALGFEVDTDAPPPTGNVTQISMDQVVHLFPNTPVSNIQTYLPCILTALNEQRLGDLPMLLMALATIKTETANFSPISEGISKYNTAPGGEPYGLYDFRTDLGNGAVGDGSRFKGRGFIQLTGKNNYSTYSQKLGLGDLLLVNPDLANDSIIAARVLASYLKDREEPIRVALSHQNYAAARAAVNGGTNGLETFQTAYVEGSHLLGLA